MKWTRVEVGDGPSIGSSSLYTHRVTQTRELTFVG